jgi:hypothetical protein
MLELVDSIRDELGSEISNQFEQKVKPALDDLYSNLETNRTALAQAVAVITGEEAPGMAAPEMPAPEGETGLEGELAATGDEFAASAPAAGGEAAAGRERRESIEYSRKLGQILNSKKK